MFISYLFTLLVFKLGHYSCSSVKISIPEFLPYLQKTKTTPNKQRNNNCALSCGLEAQNKFLINFTSSFSYFQIGSTLKIAAQIQFCH